MAFTAPLTYKSRPLVRKGAEIYYGSLSDPFVAYLQVLTTKKEADTEVSDRVHVTLLSTDTTLSLPDRLAKQSDKTGLFAALDIASIWLDRVCPKAEVAAGSQDETANPAPAKAP
ncbi:MAG: hypothetical protein RR052_04010, partial [Oscillospiraceae bacterium]